MEFKISRSKPKTDECVKGWKIVFCSKADNNYGAFYEDEKVARKILADIKTGAHDSFWYDGHAKTNTWAFFILMSEVEAIIFGEVEQEIPNKD